MESVLPRRIAVFSWLKASIAHLAFSACACKKISLLLLAASASYLAAAQPIPIIELEKFVERSSSETRVSGGLLLGATLLGESDKGFPAPRLVLPSSPVGSPFCVETVGIDGSYWSQGELPASAIRSGQTVLRIKYGKDVKPGAVSNAQILNELGATNVAVLVTAGPCDGGTSTRQVIVADRLNGSRQGKGVRLFLNASKNEVEAVYTSAAGKQVEAECFEIKSQRQRLAYDSFCDWHEPLGETTLVTVKTARFGREVLKVKFTLIVGKE